MKEWSPNRRTFQYISVPHGSYATIINPPGKPDWAMMFRVHATTTRTGDPDDPRGQSAGPRRASSHLFHLRALKVGTDGQGTRVILLHVRHCRIEIEIPDVTQYELLRIRPLRHSSHYGGESLDGIGRAHPDRQMHDEDVRTLRKIREARIGAGLVRAVDNSKP